jgi:hypothetical protein
MFHIAFIVSGLSILGILSLKPDFIGQLFKRRSFLLGTMSGRAKRSTAQKKDDAPADSKKVKAGLAKGDDLPEFELQNDEEVTVASMDLVRDSGIDSF